jgi:hypothetical protein
MQYHVQNGSFSSLSLSEKNYTHIYEHEITWKETLNSWMVDNP